MSQERDLPEVEKIPCDVCTREVPLSEAKISEAEDYVAHFCGLECYAKWKEQSEESGKK
ncbi:MAG: DUF3330 domain-containing protein [Nitrosomonadales bacterium]|nr:DUF3330 domain-containing protein [Nitrosomonadales bacterium]